jgi:hypothetical protein
MGKIHDIKTGENVAPPVLDAKTAKFIGDLRAFADMVENGQRKMFDPSAILVYVSAEGFVSWYNVGEPITTIESIGMLAIAQQRVLADG